MKPSNWSLIVTLVLGIIAPPYLRVFFIGSFGKKLKRYRSRKDEQFAVNCSAYLLKADEIQCRLFSQLPYERRRGCYFRFLKTALGLNSTVAVDKTIFDNTRPISVGRLSPRPVLYGHAL